MIRTMVYHRKKIWVVFIVCAALLLGLVGRLLYLMGAQSEYYSKKADDLHERERDIKAARGKILDINGNILADLEHPHWRLLPSVRLWQILLRNH